MVADVHNGICSAEGADYTEFVGVVSARSSVLSNDARAVEKKRQRNFRAA
jgi:hypothetical protein